MYPCIVYWLLFRVIFVMKDGYDTVVMDGDIQKETVKIVFVYKDGTECVIDAPVGESILKLAHDNDLGIEGACESSLACSTCHVILEKEYFEKLDNAIDKEEDMLDLAFGVTKTSRLCCQIKVTKDLEGMRVIVPDQTRNVHLSKK